MTNVYLTVKEERFILFILLLYTSICLVHSTTCSIDNFYFIFSYLSLLYFHVIFYISVYNIHKGLSVTKVPKLLVLQSMNCGATVLPRKK